jgi:hypothetical protein
LVMCHLHSSWHHFLFCLLRERVGCKLQRIK